jgi:hypothetical protein
MLRGVDNKRAFQSLLEEDSTDIKKMYSLWGDMVTVYSGRQLTFESDRQVAISAIASTLSKKYDDTYIAGIWMGNLLPGLAWYNADRSPRIKHSNCSSNRSHIHFPSWSWLSAERRVFMSQMQPIASCTISSVAVQNGGAEDSGPAQGSITLRAPAGTMILHMNEHCQYVSEESEVPGLELVGAEGTTTVNIETGNLCIDTWIEPCSIVDSTGAQYTSARRVVTPTGIPKDVFSATVLGLHIGWEPEQDGSRRGVFLVLARMKETPGAYSRIGLLRTKADEDLLQSWLGKDPYGEITIY